MNETSWGTGPLAAAEKMFPMTVLNLVLIALFAIAAVLVIWWGAKLRRRRHEAEELLDERGEIVRVDEHEPPSPPPPSPPPAEEAPLAPTAAEEPIPAAAPLDATPATIAADAAAPAPAPTPPAEDDLTQMKGIGPRLAERLGGLGITRFAQLAALSPAEAEALDAQLGDFRGRMARDRWIEQAKFLAAGDKAGFEAAFGKL